MSDLGSISFYIDKKTRNNSNPINIPRRKPSIWIPNNYINKCFSCNCEFGLFTRKHHCRICGRIFCYSCSQWECKSNSLISLITPPKNMDTLLNRLKTNINPNVRVCLECHKYTNVLNENKNQKKLIFLSNLPISINELLKLRIVSKTWCKNINFLISVYRSVQYKLPSEKFSKLEKKILWNHRYELKNHFYFISKCLISNKDKSEKEINKLVDYYKSNNKIYSCSSLLCRNECKNQCKIEHILEIGFNVDLNKHISLRNYLINLLVKKDNNIIQLITPWLIELSKKYISFGYLLFEKCIDINSLYSIYFELKFCLNYNHNKNLEKLMSFFHKKLSENVLNNIRKSEELIKFIRLLIDKKYSNNFTDAENELIIQSWFCQNISVRLPFNTDIECIGIDYKNIVRFNSFSKPIMIPLITKTKNSKIKKTFILVKNEDIRKDKLTMCVSKWISIICKDITINTYEILPINTNYGWIEIIDEAMTLYDIKHVHKKTLLNYIMDINPNITINKLRSNFIKTAVASCVLCYILGVGDRHTENILIDKNGNLVNIDFSYLLGDDPKNIDIDMKITPDMLDMLGGYDSGTYIKFKKKCSNVYHKIRRHSSLWSILLKYLAFSNPPIDNYYNKYELIKHHIIEKLIPGELDDESNNFMMNIIDNSSNQGFIDYISDYSHKVVNDIKNMKLNIFNLEL